MRRLLPPLLCCAVLGLVAWRALSDPAQRAEEQRIAALWEARDAAGRAQVLEQVRAYARTHGEQVDRDFLTRAYLRCRRLDLAVSARWPTGAATPSAPEVRAWARDALRAVGWDDEAQTRPSLLHAPATLALLDGGDEPTRLHVTQRLASVPVEWLYAFMRQTSWERSSATRRVLAEASRLRAQSEPAAQPLDAPWTIAAALLEERTPEAPGSAAGRDLLIAFLEGPARVQFRGRWMVASRELGRGAEPEALAGLGRLAESLAASQDPTDRRDRAVVLLGLLAGGRWEGELALRAIFVEGHPELGVLVGHAAGILAERALGGDERAQQWVRTLWEGPAATDQGLREVLARALIGDAPPTAPAAWLTDLVEDLEQPRTPPALRIQGLVHRLRQGTAPARKALLDWLVREAGEGVLEGADPEQTTIPALTALRALHRAP